MCYTVFALWMSVFGFYQIIQKNLTRITRFTWRRCSFICMMENQIKKMKKLFSHSVYAWHPRPISSLDTPAFHFFSFQNTILFQTPRSQKQQTHLLPICTRRLWKHKSVFLPQSYDPALGFNWTCSDPRPHRVQLPAKVAPTPTQTRSITAQHKKKT